MGLDTPSASVLPALDPGRVTATATTATPTPTLNNADKDSTLLLPHTSMVAATMRQASTALPLTVDKETRPATTSSHDATDYRVPSYPHPHSHQPSAPAPTNPTVRHPAPEAPRLYNPRPSEYPPANTGSANVAPYDSSSRFQPPPPSQRHRLPHSLSVSQATSSTNDADLVFTPPSSEGGRSPSKPNSHDSSQDSQLLQLSQIAAAQERIPENGNALSRKRMADGMVKPTYERPSPSPAGTASHTRNTSAVSMASTATSRLGELSAELKTRLSYAMVKVNNGWQSHSIDQVESLASCAGSPASSNSTVHMRNGSSASPQLLNLQRRGSHVSMAPGGSQQYPTSSQQYPSGSQQHPPSSQQHPSGSQQQHSQGRPVEGPYARESGHFAPRYNPSSQAEPIPSVTLAPPAPIQPTRQQFQHPRRNSVSRNTQAFLAINHQPPPQQGLNTAGQPNPYLTTHHHRTSLMDPPMYPPHQNVREQDAIESLLFMSSPGNSANLKHGFPSSSQPLASSQPSLTSSQSQPLPSGHAQPSQQRTALPSSQPRKSLPSARPTNHPRAHQTQSQPTQQKRVGFQKSPNAMDIDDGTYGVSQYSNNTHNMNNTSRGTPRKRGGYNGHASAAGGGEAQQQHAHGHGHAHAHAPIQKLKQMPVSSGLTVPSRPSQQRTGLKEEDIDRMLELAAARERRDSDSEGEIQIPVSRGRREGAAGIVRA
ncbi:hypothetical protein SMACR_05617 [Sordaria macrospora]|uniref:WGS project CABT00000000 data, contig 2.30 n=2 Tax=Sordaria macrospora TaxID=5147 RepID=F7W567_SORMK|nr:uncharacterized protein SMAC_05617 [Sordaria macrospora k-hell]KAA8630545.1 hypothetical protein SMACR_05617 [Sordaria macrospora]WPJ62512.1 hypothetical protein SMAC4_05617 [Sordaria macrospora]CCC12655.1 unnamed protein product [Sordaria macrospora k-hell]